MPGLSKEHDLAQLSLAAQQPAEAGAAAALPETMSGWEAVDSIASDSGFSGTAFQNAATGDTAVVLQSAATDMAQDAVTDAATDAAMSAVQDAGGESLQQAQQMAQQAQQMQQQAQEAKQFVEQVSSNTGQMPTLTGNGAGGSLAQSVGAQTGAPTTTFNAMGGSDLVPADTPLDAANTQNITNYHTTPEPNTTYGDPIGQTVHSDPSSLGPAPDWHPAVAEAEGESGSPTNAMAGGGKVRTANAMGESSPLLGALVAVADVMLAVQDFNTKLGIGFLTPKGPIASARHFDPVLGIDIHLVLLPPGVPVPIPHPFIGMLIDLFDYLPYIGSTVQVNSVERAQASTGGRPIPFHFPIGGPFAVPPGHECEMFMGSSTVTVDGEPFSYLALPALSCQIVGMPTPFRIKPKKTFSLTLPLTVVLPIPHGKPVEVGGAPTISLMALAMKGLFKGLGKLQKASKRWKALSDRIHRAMAAAMKKGKIKPNSAVSNRVHRAICKVTGHPVDVATGKVFTEAVDFDLPGPLPLVWERVWYSTATHQGDLGHGWHHRYDLGLVINDEGALLRTADGRYTVFEAPTVEQPSYNPQEKLWLSVNTDGRYWIEDLDGLCHTFTEPLDAHKGEAAIGERLVEQVVDANRNRIRFIRTGMGDVNPMRLKQIIDSAGRTLHVKTSPNGRIGNISIAPDPEQPNKRQTLVGYDYNDAGDLTKVYDAYDQPFRFEYKNHLLVKETDRNDLSFYFAWDDAINGPDPETAKCIKTWGDDLGNGELYYRELSYDLDNQITSVIEGNPAHLPADAEPKVRTYQWNKLGVVTAETDPLGNTVNTAWDEFGNKLSETDAAGNSTSYAYDEAGRLVSTTNANGETTEIHYDDDNNPVGLVDAEGSEWRFSYDDRHNLVSTADPQGGETQYRRLPNGLPQVITDPLGQQRSYVWNDAGELVAETNANGYHIRYQHDGLGNIVAIADEQQTDKQQQQTRYAYDLANRLIGITDGSGQSTELRYNAAGKLTDHIDASGRHTQYQYGQLPVIKTRISPDGAKFHYDYDDELNLIGLVNENGERYQLAYDANDQLIEETGFDGRVQQYTYDAAGQLLRHRDGAFRQTRFERDPVGRLLKKLGSDGEQSSFEYDAVGRLTAALNAHREVRYDYDAVGNVTAERQLDVAGTTPADEVVLQHGYDALGRRIATTLPDGRTLHTAFDAEGHYTQMTLGLGGADSPDQRLIKRLQRDALGRVLHSTMGEAKQLTADYQYDPQGRLQQQHVQRQSKTVIQRDYGYDQLGRLSTIQDVRKGLSEYQYDQRDRLVGVRGARPEQFVYDPAGNILQGDMQQDESLESAATHASKGLTTHTAEGNRLQVFQDRKFEYDEVGNLVLETRGNPVRETTHYRYSHANQLIEVTTFGRRYSYEYDALGRRTKKQCPDSTTTFYWNGDVLLAEETRHVADDTDIAAHTNAPKLGVVNADGQVTPANGSRHSNAVATEPTNVVTYLYEPYSFRPLAQLRRLGETTDKFHEDDDAESIYFYHLDHLGTPLEITDEHGNLEWSVTYRAYGNVLKQHKARIENNLRFQGQYFDTESGLHYNRFRYYHPTAGRFIHQDPIGLSGGNNLYNYPTMPTEWVDPLGLECTDFKTPSEYKDHALKRQNIDPDNPPNSFKESWTDSTDIKYEVRAHPANPAHGKTGSIYRVSRKRPGVDENGQGLGREYMDIDGNWHRESTLKPGPAGQPNSTYNPTAAADTHIQL